MNQTIENFGSYIKSLREKKRLSLEEMAAKTKISLQYLAALEENRLEELPSKTHERLFLRAYLQQLGEDLDQLTTRFKDIELTEEFKYKPKPKVKKSIYLDLIFIAGGVVLLSVIIWALFIDSPDNSVESQINPARISLPLTGESATPKVVSETLAPAVTSAVKPEKLVLRLEATGKSWVEINADGHKAFYDFISPHQKKEWSCKDSFVITLGNPAAVIAYVNDQKLKPLSTPSNKPAIDIKINLENYKTFLEERAQ
ncbi:MAG: hypothetical protein A2145_05070 [candidate division Zixibacteria bacterium RBG_16_40_9]|nr:MAG: hypothetical protein A2145_05070 [candidate division Zixibacteria bacterium RBG_16_40_9]